MSGGACFYIRSIISLVLILSCSLRLFAALDAGTLIVFLFSQVGKNAVLGAVALKSSQCAVQRLIFLDMYF